MKNPVCLLYANCIPVKGAKNSIICDLQRHNYLQIPNDLYNILINHKGKSIQEIKAYYNHQYDEIIDDYFKVLLDYELAFLTDTPELFPDLSLNWEAPLEISNAIIDFDEQSAFDLFPVLDQLSDLGCKFIQFRFYHKIDMAKVASILLYLDRIQSNSIGVDFVLPFQKTNPNEAFIQLFKQHPRLNTVIFYGSPFGKHIHPMGASKYLIHMATEIVSEKSCGVIEKGLFSINLKTFTEAQQHNTCLNGKISVDKRGEIRNCPSMPASFGHVDEVPLSTAIKKAQFKKYWSVHKDQIEVCKDCEFRYICTDCRAYTTDASNPKSKPLKCGYNPYTGEWKAWSTNPLKEQAEAATV